MALPNQHGETHGEPSNPKLWHAITMQARAKFSTYPSPAAAHWVHQQYIQHGGQFTETKHKKKRHP